MPRRKRTAMSLTWIAIFNVIVQHMAKAWTKFLKFLSMLLLFDLMMTAVYMAVAYDTAPWGGLRPHADDTLVDKIFNRFYYSVNVSTAFGLGPVSPASKTLKLITVVQMYLTLGLFLSKYNPLRL